MRKIFFHVDVNSAYLSWEATKRKILNPNSTDLRDIPSVISGNPEKRSGIVLAKSTKAKQCGVITGESIYHALKKCPTLKVVPCDFDLYLEYSSKFINFLGRYSPDVYQYSIDEAFVDMTGMQKIFGDPISCANSMRERIYKELGFTINIGISSNMVLAKMASDFEKPNMTHTLFPDEIEEKMWPLPVGDLFFVGRRTRDKLKRIGIYTIGDLAKSDPKILREIFKKHGDVIYNHANGIDGYEFIHTDIKNKSVGNSTTTSFDITSINEASYVILSLCETVCSRLRKKGLKSSVVSIEIVYMDFKRSHMQMKLPIKTNNVSDIYKASISLFEKLWNKNPVRHIGVNTSKAEKEDNLQLSFFDQISTKEEKLYRAMDNIRNKYGNDSIYRARFLKGNLSHMEGGSSVNKKDGIVLM